MRLNFQHLKGRTATCASNALKTVVGFMLANLTQNLKPQSLVRLFRCHQVYGAHILTKRTIEPYRYYWKNESIFLKIIFEYYKRLENAEFAKK